MVSAAGVEFLEQALYEASALHIQPGGRLIKKQYLGITDEGHAQDQALLHSLGISLDQVVLSRLKSQLLQQAFASFSGLLGRNAVEA